jgi:uncharacterized membrane protein
MKQDDINDIEWRNPSNWTWRGPLGLYASKRDTRLLVPKATPMMGWTLNFGHPSWVYVVAGIAVLPLAFEVIRRVVE